jgi:hypothetical protein
MYTSGNIFLDIIISIIRLLYDLYKIAPLYIKILFWLIILALIIWFIRIMISVIKERNNPTSTQPNN